MALIKKAPTTDTNTTANTNTADTANAEAAKVAAAKKAAAKVTADKLAETNRLAEEAEAVKVAEDAKLAAEAEEAAAANMESGTDEVGAEGKVLEGELVDGSAENEAAKTGGVEAEVGEIVADEAEKTESTVKSADKESTVKSADKESTVKSADKEADSTTVATTGTKGAMPANITEKAAEEGFEGTELGFGSFPVIKLPSEGIFSDSDDNDMGKHIRAALQQSKEAFLYQQEDVKDGPVGFSYDGVTLSAYKGEGDDSYSTVEELRAAWAEEGYEIETKKYLEVIAVIVEDHEEFIEGDVAEGLQDLEGEPAIFRIPPSSVKAFSGKVATLNWAGKPIKGAIMDFMVGKKRVSGANKYYPWKFRVVK